MFESEWDAKQARMNEIDAELEARAAARLVGGRKYEALLRAERARLVDEIDALIRADVSRRMSVLR